MRPAVITIGIDPDIHLGPLMLSWHGLTIALGVLVGGLIAGVWLRQRKLSTEPLYAFGAVVAVGAIVGSRLFYVIEHGGPLLGTRGFTFFGGLILSAVLLAIYVRRTGLPGAYLDAAAAGLPLGVAVGRIGDVINGEHYGARSDFFLAVRNSHPDAMTPNPELAYQNGGLYEVLIGLLIFAIIWPLRHRLPRTGDLAWLVLGLFAIGRFFELFIRVADPKLALGLNNAQWTSIAILAVVIAGWAFTSRHGRAATGHGKRRPESA
jgi:phosphatidylglycerol:prolipoprotein diacylglycerol transferase